MNITSAPASINDDHAYYGVSSSYPLSNIIGVTSSEGTKYAGINLTRGSNAVSYLYIDFDFSQIPSNAIINKVTGSVKIYGSTTSQSRTSVRQVQLYSGTNPKGEYESFSCTGAANIVSIDNGGSWTREELDDTRIRLYVTRNTSSTSTNTYVYLMGADVTVEYEERPTVTHTVSVDIGSDVSIDGDLTQQVYEGSAHSITIHGTLRSLTDNGVDVLAKAVEHETVSSGNITSNPTSYTTSGSIQGTRYTNAVGMGSSNTASGNDYCSRSGSTASITYSFDLSDVPTDAVIEAVNVKVGGHLENASQSTATLQLYAGSTTKGVQSRFTSTSKQVITMDTGSWTRDELQQARLVFTIGYYGGLVNGVDFEVLYSLPNGGEVYSVYTIAEVNEDHLIQINLASTGPALFVKIEGFWVSVGKVFRKQNGSWVEISISDMDSTANYVSAS